MDCIMKEDGTQGFLKEPNGEKLPHAGEWKYIVEWWEQDSLDVDSNQHLLFIDEEGETDFLVHEGNVTELNELLASTGLLEVQEVSIVPEFHVQFHSRILYPPEWAGEAYFEPDTARTWLKKLHGWMGFVKMAKRKSLP